MDAQPSILSTLFNASATTPAQPSAAPAPVDLKGNSSPTPGTRANPVDVSKASHIAKARQQIADDPSDAQKEAGNYKKGHVVFEGLPISIETPKGGVRSGVGPDGKPWSVKMPADYGYVKRTSGADGGHVDVFIGDRGPTGKAFVIDQHDPSTGKFDEHKVVLSARTPAEAMNIYRRSFSDKLAPKRAGTISEVSVDRLKEWLAKGDMTKSYGASAI